MTPDSLESQHTLTTAVARSNELRTQELLAGQPGAAGTVGGGAAEGGAAEGGVAEGGVAEGGVAEGGAPPVLGKHEALELLALSEVITRKAAYGRQLTVRSARAAGASWSQIGAALGTSKQSAWEAHTRWIDQQAGQHARLDYEGMSAHDAAAARALAGPAADGRPG
jgi:hypothetical protein